MTQAFNLGQLANKVNTSGQLDASTGLVNTSSVTNGGTGRATLTAGTVLVGAGTSQVTMLAGTTTNDALIWNGTAWASTPVSAAGGGGGYLMTMFTSPATYTKPTSLKSIKVTVVGAGGNGGASTPNPGAGAAQGGGGGGGGAAIYYASAPLIPAPQTITAGTGTSSFGSIVSATAGGVGGTSGAGGGVGAGGTAGTGAGGQINLNGTAGTNGGSAIATSMNGSSALFQSVRTAAIVTGSPGTPNTVIGAGGSGAASGPVGTTRTGGTGAPGIVIIEEFF